MTTTSVDSELGSKNPIEIYRKLVQTYFKDEKKVLENI